MIMEFGALSRLTGDPIFEVQYCVCTVEVSCPNILYSMGHFTLSQEVGFGALVGELCFVTGGLYSHSA